MKANSPLLLAGCMVADEAGRVLLIHRSTPELTQWEMPGGKVEPGEDPQRTAVREINEELGIDVAVSEKIGIQHFDFRGTPCEYHYFRASITDGQPATQEVKHDQWQFIDITNPNEHFSQGVQGLSRLLHGQA